MLATLGLNNGWSGAIVFGCIRDADIISKINFGVKALNTNPRKSLKQGKGERDLTVLIADIKFNVGEYVYADEDGIVTCKNKLNI